MRKRNHVRKPNASPMARVLEPKAAGIDIGSTEIYVAVPPDREPEPVRCFTTFTKDLVIAAWLQKCEVQTVAMESTGVFWIPLYQILEDRGFRVCLVNARHVKHVPGRKSDVADCQWLPYLHSVGLLRASHRPPQVICAMRSIWRHRESLVQMAAVHIQHMQKSLEEIIAEALVGDYRPEHLFTLRQSLQAYRQYQRWISACDTEIESDLRQLNSKLGPNQKPLSKLKDRHKPLGARAK